MQKVLVAGVAVADIVMRVEAFPRKAEKYRATDASVTVGGCAANAAIAVARQGGNAMLAARIGGDPVGDLIVGQLSVEGVDISLCSRSNGALSSFSSVFVDPSGDRQIMNFRGRGLSNTLDLTTAPPADAVLADNRWSPLTKEALNAARRWGVPGIVDAEAPFDAEAVQGASHIAFSVQGLRDYAPDLSLEDALGKAHAEFEAWIAVTDGADGVWFTGPQGISHMSAFPIDAVDTLGAGDVWHGVFALKLAEGSDETNAIRFANAAAALKCRSFGGVAACPRASETKAFLREMT